MTGGVGDRTGEGARSPTQRSRSSRILLRPLFRRFAPSLRLQVALVIAALSFLPNLAVALMLFLPYYGRGPDVAPAPTLPLLFWLLAMIGLSAGIGYGLSRLLLSPLTHLTREVSALQHAAAQVSALSLPPDGYDPREIVALRQAFGELLARVELERSRRSSFMATLMHDLKTPLIAENHLLTVIRDNDALSKGERTAIADKLLAEKRHLIDLVQKMVDAHKFEREDVPLRKEATDLRELLESVVARLEPLAAERGVALELSGAGAAEVDARELERALYNLADNALRYARSRVRLCLQGWHIEVEDDGPGLPAPLEVLAQTFNAQPVVIAGGRYTAGSGGLGLFIARRIIEAHGGELSLVRSDSSGTTFGLRL